MFHNETKYTSIFAAFALFQMLPSCAGENKKPVAKSTGTSSYVGSTYTPPVTTSALTSTGSLRIQVNGSLTNTLQGSIGAPVNWSFQAVSGATSGNAVIYSMTSSPQPTGLTIQETDSASASVSWTPTRSTEISGNISVSARDMTACAASSESASCSNYSTKLSADLVQTFVWTITGSTTSSQGSTMKSAMTMGMLLGGLSGFASSGNLGTAVQSGLSMSMKLMLMQSMMGSGLGSYSVPYGGMGYGTGLGYGTSMGTYPYGSTGSYTNPYGTGVGSNCSMLTSAQCPMTPGCSWNGISCTSTAMGYGASSCAMITNAQTCAMNTMCRWTGTTQLSGTCVNR